MPNMPLDVGSSPIVWGLNSRAGPVTGTAEPGGRGGAHRVWRRVPSLWFAHLGVLQMWSVPVPTGRVSMNSMLMSLHAGPSPLLAGSVSRSPPGGRHVWVDPRLFGVRLMALPSPARRGEGQSPAARPDAVGHPGLAAGRARGRGGVAVMERGAVLRQRAGALFP